MVRVTEVVMIKVILKVHPNLTPTMYVNLGEIETSLDITGIVAVFTPSNREQKDHLRYFLIFTLTKKSNIKDLTYSQ